MSRIAENSSGCNATLLRKHGSTRDFSGIHGLKCKTISIDLEKMDGVVPDVEDIMKDRTDEVSLEKLTVPPKKLLK